MNTWETIKEDYKSAYSKDAKVVRVLSRAWADPSFRTVLRYRFSCSFKNFGVFGSVFSNFLWRRNIFKAGCFLSPKASIGPGLVLPHAVGVVIGENVKIGQNVKIFQNVTIGVASETMNQYPVIEDNVVIYTGVCIIGSVTVGSGSVIAANAVVNKDVSELTLVGGVPAKFIKALE